MAIVRSVTSLLAVAALTNGWAIASEPWMAGVASVVITPGQPMWMGGYASRTEPSNGKIHELYAKALLLEDKHGQRVVIVTVDLLGITPELRAVVAARVKNRFSLAPDALVLNASHTHCGPEIREGLILQRNGDATYAALARQYTRDLADKIVSLVGRAIAERQPARVRYSFGRAGFAMNRRLPTATGFQNSPYPDGPVDHRVPVLCVTTKANRLAAILFGYACHNTTLGNPAVLRRLCRFRASESRSGSSRHDCLVHGRVRC